MTLFLQFALMPFRRAFLLGNFRKALRLTCILALGTLVHASEGSVTDNQGASAISASADGQAPEYTPEEEASFERGSTAYFHLCHVCHGPDGNGAPIVDDPDGRRMAPSLSRSWRVVGRPEYTLTALLHGVTGPVDGVEYQGQMVSMSSYGDAWIADVASFIRNSFENSASMVTSNQVARIRKRIGDRAEPFTVPEILTMMPVALTNQAVWKVTASHNSATATNAIRGASKATAWTAGIPQKVGTWFQIELPEPVTVWEIQLESLPSLAGTTTSFPRAYEVQASINGSDWSKPISQGAGTGPRTVISFDPIRTKVIRITLTSPAPDAPAWSICRTQLFQAGQPAPKITGLPRTNLFE